MATKPIRYPQTIHKVAAIDKDRPGLTAAQVAKEIGSTPTVITDARFYIRKFHGDLDAAIRFRNATSLKSCHKTRADARKWRDQVEAEWKKSGIDGPVEPAEPLYEPGATKLAMVAAIDRAEPGLSAHDIAARINSTPNSIGTYRFWLRKAEGEPRLAYQMQRKGLLIDTEGQVV